MVTGDLHLKIRKVGNVWYAAELDLVSSLSYGTYEWELSSRYDQFADNTVVGLFTYQSPASVASQAGGAGRQTASRIRRMKSISR